MINIYEQGYNDYTTMGLGALTPSACIVREEQGGAYELELDHPMDDNLLYDLLAPGRVIKVPVPAQTTPLYRILSTPDKVYYKADVETPMYSIKSEDIGHYETVTRTRTTYKTVTSKPKPEIVVYRTLSHPVVITKQGKPRTTYKPVEETYTEEVWVQGESRILANIPAGAEFLRLAVEGEWARVVSPAGQPGWMKAEGLTLSRVVPGAPGEAVQGKKVREQLFRVYRVEKDTEGLQVKAWARHVYYDLAGNVIMAGKHDGASLYSLINSLGANCSQPRHGYSFYTDSPAVVLTDVDYTHKGMVEAHLDPEEGILAKANLRMVRDNFDVYFTARSSVERTPITYGNNLLGLQYEVNEDSIINRIIPLGQDKDGNVVLPDEQYIDSPRNGDETIIRAKAIEYSEAREQEPREATDTRPADPGMTIAQVKDKLRELAAADFDSGIDLPDVELRVDFLQLGDTAEYQQYRHLDRLYLGDIVAIRDLVHGLDVEAELTEYEYNVLTARYDSIRVGITSAKRTVGSVESFMLPNGSIGGTKIIRGGIDASRIGHLAVKSAHIGLAAIQTAHIQDAAIQRAHIQDAAVGTAQIEEASIVSAHIQNGTIEDAHIGTAGIDFARIKDLAAGTAVITEGIGGKLIIDRLAVSEANIVNLTAGQLIVQGASGALYQLTVNEDGDVITELRQIGNADIADVSLNAGEKLIKSSITADLLNVQEIFASEALIGAIRAHNIEAHSIGVDQLTPGLFESMISNATGQQLVVEFSNGTILDRENTQTIARIRVFHQGVDITERMPESAISWERISEDKAGDALWNADPLHQNRKNITLNAADVDFRGVLRTQINEARLYAIPSVDEDGNLTMVDYGDGDSLNFAMVAGDLIYDGPTAYESRGGELYTDMLIGAFFLDTQLSNLKTSYMDISRHGMELYADGYLSLIAGSKFNMRAGAGSKAIGLSNDHVFDYFAWAGAENPQEAPFWVKMDGTVRATKLQLNNSNITDFTQMYPYADAENASPAYPMTFRIFIPAECSGVQSVKLTFACEPFRAYSTGAASGGGATSSAGGGGARTSRAGGGGTSGTVLLLTTLTLPAEGTPHRHGTESHSHTVYSHSHILDIPDHTHTVPNHTHNITYGIYTGTTATGVEVEVDGTLVGNFSGLTARDITAHLTKSGDKITRDAWHIITLKPNNLTRIVAQAFVVAVMGRANNAIF